MRKAKPNDFNSETTNTNDDASMPNLSDCFIITPIGSVGGEIYKKMEGLVFSVLSPILEIHGYRPVVSSSISAQGSINKQILSHLVSDKLVVANLTGLNPNVMYELAVRHAIRLPVITIAEKDTQLPFDVTDQRTIFYEDSFNGIKSLRDQLKLAIEDIDRDDHEVENPIYDAIKSRSIIKAIAPSSNEAYIINTLNKIESKLSNLDTKSKQQENLNTLKVGPYQRKFRARDKTHFDRFMQQAPQMLADIDVDTCAIDPDNLTFIIDSETIPALKMAAIRLANYGYQ